MAGHTHDDFPKQTLQQRYEIQQLLGKKAGRRTLLARDHYTQQLVIIKLLTFSSNFAWEDLKLFEREAETLKALEHPAIPRYIDYFELDSASSKGYALVQSYVAGKSLEEEMQLGRKFSESEAKEIAKSLLEILIYLHKRQPPVIHRDIKPSNIILADRSGNSAGIYLVDFGSVRTLASKASKTVTVVGTYGYMPPEQFGGYATRASDLYSLGATLIALTTATHPAELPHKDMRIVFEDAAHLSPGFVDWLQWMTEPSLEQRLTSAQAAKSALKQGQSRFTELRAINSGKAVNTRVLFWAAIWRSTLIGGIAVTMCAAVYSSVAYPFSGAILGGGVGGLIGIPLAFANGFLVAIITRLFFYPLKNADSHRRTVSIISTILGTAIALIYFKSLERGYGYNDSIVEKIFWVIAPSVITGLSMGIASQSIARWYEMRHRYTRRVFFQSNVKSDQNHHELED